MLRLPTYFENLVAKAKFMIQLDNQVYWFAL